MEHSALGHHGPIILNRRDFTNRQVRAAGSINRSQSFLISSLRMPCALISQERFIPFVSDITNEVGPRDRICAFDEPRVGYRPERFSDVTCVGNISVGREEDGTETSGIGSVSEGGLC